MLASSRNNGNVEVFHWARCSRNPALAQFAVSLTDQTTNTDVTSRMAVRQRDSYCKASWMCKCTLRARGWAGGSRSLEMVRLTVQTLSCTARARVPKPARRAARLHVRRANARRVTPRGFDVPSRLGRRAEAGPCQLLRRVRRRTISPEHLMQPPELR